MTHQEVVPVSVTLEKLFRRIKLFITLRTEAPFNVRTGVGPTNCCCSSSSCELSNDAERVQRALQQVPHNPRPEWHAGVLVGAERENRRANREERGVPRDVERHHRPRVGPLTLPALHLRCRRLPHPHRRLPQHHAPPARAPEEGRRRV